MLALFRFAVVALFLFIGTSARGGVLVASARSYGGAGYPAGNYYYHVDSLTGLATRVSGFLGGNYVDGLAGTTDGRLLGYSSGFVVEVNAVTGTQTPIGGFSGLNMSGFDILEGSGYGVPLSGPDQRLRRVDLSTGLAASIGELNQIGSAMDAYFGDPAGVNHPAILGLGSVGGTLYGVHTVAGKNNLLALDPVTGSATVLGSRNAVALSGNPGDGIYSGFSAMTGMDENNDGVYEALLGSVNAYDPDGDGPLAIQRIGGVARYELASGTWSLIGTNPGLEFYGFGAPIPEPTSGLAVTWAVLWFGRKPRGHRFFAVGDAGGPAGWTVTRAS